MASGAPLIHVANGSDAEQARALLGARFDVRVLDQVSPGALSALGLDRVGVWGGSAALDLALQAPERVDVLILEAPTLPADASALRQVTAPTLVIFGTEDRIVSPETGRVFREMLPNCNYILVYRAGHQVAVDRPEAFASLVGDFLERREAFIVSQKSALLHP